VTSIVAGSGISVSAATGAVTVTATSGAGNSISNGTSNVSISSANGNVDINPTNAGGVYTRLRNSTLASYMEFTANGLSASTNYIAGTEIYWTAPANFYTTLKIPVYTVASKPTIALATGQIIAISDSPTYTGRLAYWAGASTWRYVSDNAAV
jgi:hypothetical protein